MITKTEEVTKVTFDLSNVGVGDIVEYKLYKRRAFSGWGPKVEWAIVSQVSDKHLVIYARHASKDYVDEVVISASQAANIRVLHRHPSNV